MYQAEPDPYCYPGTSVLINRLDIRDQAALEAFEADATAERSSHEVPPGSLDYDHYLAIHRHLFQDIYDWAGSIRTVRVAKQGNAFCYPEYIDREMRRLFSELAGHKHFRDQSPDVFAAMAAHFLAELNAIHPFREGNGRTQLSFLTLLAEEAGHPLALERLNPDATLQAMIKSFDGDERPLAAIIGELMS
jgi:cell filamentation protein, protein adenylyltransferase